MQSDRDFKDEKDAEHGQEAREEASGSPRQFRDEFCDPPQFFNSRHELPSVRAAPCAVCGAVDGSTSGFVSDTQVVQVEKQLDILSADLGPRVQAIEEWMSSGGFGVEYAFQEREAEGTVRLDP
jgi:hypothetical protein